MPSFVGRMFSIARSAVKTENGIKWTIAGWLRFIVSTLFFIAAAWRAGGILALAGGIFFLVPASRFWCR